VTYPSAHSLQALKALDINPGRMGCVMLDVEPLDLSGVIPQEWAYTSENPDRKWVSGIQTKAHVTLLYGLLHNANRIKYAVDEVLEGWKPQAVRVNAYDVFPSPFPDEPYGCVVARQLAPSPNLMQAHTRLSLLPHINTYPEYKPHVTLAYVRKEYVKDTLQALQKKFPLPRGFKPLGLNYGDDEEPC
jgi:2'-5' RNA ligase